MWAAVSGRPFRAQSGQVASAPGQGTQRCLGIRHCPEGPLDVDGLERQPAATGCPRRGPRWGPRPRPRTRWPRRRRSGSDECGSDFPPPAARDQEPDPEQQPDPAPADLGIRAGGRCSCPRPHRLGGLRPPPMSLTGAICRGAKNKCTFALQASGDAQYHCFCAGQSGGAEGTRTPDPLTARKVRCVFRASTSNKGHAPASPSAVSRTMRLEFAPRMAPRDLGADRSRRH